MRVKSVFFVPVHSTGLMKGVRALGAFLLLLGFLASGVAWACDEPAGSKALKFCQLTEEGVQANLQGHYGRADAIWQQLRELEPTDLSLIHISEPTRPY